MRAYFHFRNGIYNGIHSLASKQRHIVCNSFLFICYKIYKLKKI